MSNDMYWILDNREPVAVTTEEWATWFETSERTVCKTKVGDREVSTVFLGLNHRFTSGPPLLFETMVFPEQDLIERYSTWDEAMAGHMAIVYRMRREEAS